MAKTLRRHGGSAAAIAVLATFGCNAVIDNDDRWFADGEVDASFDVAQDDASIDTSIGALDAAQGAETAADAAVVGDASVDPQDVATVPRDADGATKDQGADDDALDATRADGSQVGSDARLSPCVTAPECTAGASERDDGACGLCNKGTRSRTRTCSSECRWGAWSNWGACSPGAVECQPGATRTQSAGCGACGSRTQTQTCSDSCAWGGWVDTSNCSDHDCCAEVQWCDDTSSSAGTVCRQTGACPKSEVDADCREDIQTVCGGKVVQPFVMKYW